jgi:hypothetical protein
MSPLAPFRHRAFFWLWLGVVVASVGTWAQMVGAQWLFVHDPNAATIVTLVQTASTLPMMLLALPAGVLADAFDRRWLMFGVQIYFIVVAALLAGLTTAGLMPPALLLTFTFAVGAGQAMLSPTWQALIAHWGVPPVFAMTAVCSCFLAVVLLAWRRPRVTHGEREPFMPALVAGGRYVRHEPVVRKILLRFATFMVPACAVWALLPLIASQQLGLNADGYGLLFAALGLGAVIAALCLGWVKQHLSSNGVLELAAISFALAFGSIVLVPNAWVTLPSARRMRLRLDGHRLHHHLRAAAVSARLGTRPRHRDLPHGVPGLTGDRVPDLGTHHPTFGPSSGHLGSCGTGGNQCGYGDGA